MKKTDVKHALRLFVLSLAALCAMTAAVSAASDGAASFPCDGSVAGGTVNVRTGPGTSYDRVTQLASGKAVTVLGTEDGWYRVSFGGVTGYILGDYVELAAPRTGTVTGGTVNVRTGPGTSYGRVTQLASGKTVSILGAEDGWYRVSFDGKEGYILGDYLTAGAAAPAADASVSAATVTGGTVNVRKGPGTSYDRVTQLSAGKSVTVLGQDGEWFRVSFDGKEGYILGDYLAAGGLAAPAPVAAAAPAAVAPAPAAASVSAASVTGDAVNVRTGPGTSYDRVTQLSAGKSVTVLGQDGEWFRVSFDGREGYILGKYLAAADGSALASDERVGVVAGGTVNVRSGPGTSYDRVTQVYTGKRVTILGEDGEWFRVSFDGRTGYILGKYVLEGEEAEAAAASSVGAAVAADARQYLGVRYVWGGETPKSGFDCSGLTMYLYKQYGYSLPHTATGQYRSCGRKVSRSELQPGDLIFFTAPGEGGSISHVGVYIGGGDFIHAKYHAGQVTTNSLYENYYSTNYVGAIRIG